MTKIEDLTDEQLDHFCAIAQGWEIKESESGVYWNNGKKHLYAINGMIGDKCRPTTNATQCMEIQECEKISVNFEFEGCWSADNYNVANETRDSATHGTTAKRAIIACFVKSELGEEVDCG